MRRVITKYWIRIHIAKPKGKYYCTAVRFMYFGLTAHCTAVRFLYPFTIVTLSGILKQLTTE